MENDTTRNFSCFMNNLKLGLVLDIQKNFNPLFMEMTDVNNCKPIHVACHNGLVKVVDFFVYKSVDLESISYNGWRPIHYACFSGNLEIVDLLICNNCNIEAPDDKNWRPIHWSCHLGHFDIVKLLIDKNCDINAPGLDELRPIHIACRRENKEIVKLLIDNQCSLDVCDTQQRQAIHIASFRGNIEIMKILIGAKCDLEIGDKKNQWPSDIAKKNGHNEIYDLLKNEINNNIINSIVLNLELNCDIECDHEFCAETIRAGNVKKGYHLGEGCFGKVYKYKIPKSEREVVIKWTKNDSDENSLIEHNINKYRFLINHDRIVQYYGALEQCKKLFIYMEYVSGGSLDIYISKENPLPHNQSIFFCKQILEGVAFLHDLKIIHRDIKSPNILLDKDKNIKLTDFGLSRSLKVITLRSQEHKAKTFCGTVNYMSPEIMKDEPYSFPSDIWSVGAVMTEMISGNIPFYNDSLYSMVQTVTLNGTIKYRPQKRISRELEAFIDKMLQLIPSRRATAKTLLDDEIILKNHWP